MDDETDKYIYWRRIKRTLLERSRKPWRHPSFVLYFFASVLLVGGAGIWLELHKFLFPMAGECRSLENLRTALITFFPALAGSACMQVILEENDDRALRASAVCVLITLSILALAIAPSSVSSPTSITLGLVGCLLALWAWWIANANQPGLQDGRTDAAIGRSNPNSSLQGSLEGFSA
jgi:hypothetical protein